MSADIRCSVEETGSSEKLTGGPDSQRDLILPTPNNYPVPASKFVCVCDALTLTKCLHYVNHLHLNFTQNSQL